MGSAPTALFLLSVTRAPNGPPTILSSSCTMLFVLLLLLFSSHLVSPYMIAQMIDKIWYDWQNLNIESQFSYGGGSVAALTNFTEFTLFPTGLPPYLNVSVLSNPPKGLVCSRILFAFLSSTAIYPVTVCGTTLPFGTSCGRREIPCATTMLRH